MFVGYNLNTDREPIDSGSSSTISVSLAGGLRLVDAKLSKTLVTGVGNAN
jgi:hypothetical protein